MTEGQVQGKFPASRGLSRRGKMKRFILPRHDRPLLAGKREMALSLK